MCLSRVLAPTFGRLLELLRRIIMADKRLLNLSMLSLSIF
jgi:hypothetical protein